MLGNDCYNDKVYFLNTQMKNKYSGTFNKFFEKLSFGSHKRTIFPKIGKISKKSFSSVQHRNIFLMIGNDCYNDYVYILNTHIKNKYSGTFNDFFLKLSFEHLKKTYFEKIRKISKNQYLLYSMETCLMLGNDSYNY